MPADLPTDVVIAGAGPNGLMLACELGLAGVRPVVLERLPAPGTEPRANGLVGQVVRMLDRRGLYERLSGSTHPPQPTSQFPFGAMRLDLTVLAGNPLYTLPVPQARVVEVLVERANELGVEIRWGHELTGLNQDGDAVTVGVTGPDGSYELRARYLVGADGGHSPTRKLAGIGFPGVTTDQTVSRTAHATVPAEWVDPATGALDVPGHGTIPPFMHHRTDSGLFVFAPFPGRTPMVTTVEFDRLGSDRPMTLGEMRESVRRVLGAEVPLGPPDDEGPHVLRRLEGGNSRVADRFRDGRVLLVGDAAHVHSAIGGPGLNLGLQDAVNLGWKLAAEVGGDAPAGLLDTYEAERRPASRRVLMHTQAQSALIAPGSEVTALRELFTELLADPQTVAHIAGLMSGADIRYDMGAAATHPLVGRWAPDMLLDVDGRGSVRLVELTRTARPLLLDLTDGASVAAATARWTGDWAGRLDVVTARPQPSGVPATALLLRPDCYVAWASAAPRPDTAELTALADGVGRWFGGRLRTVA
ncbi:FAD-dependent monooxygenase [Pseudonocardia aurantiaca]|uniref:FAD-dependent monooxygenase n=1 Tax=Pseudonocardia aurantiaca TaxID=75290 RepID=A0ABW4FNH0_9PSEU